MTDTARAPTLRTDAFYWKHPISEYEGIAHPSDCDAWVDFARQLERELEQARADIEERDRRIAELEQTVLDFRHEMKAGDEREDALRERCERLRDAASVVIADWEDSLNESDMFPTDHPMVRLRATLVERTGGGE